MSGYRIIMLIVQVVIIVKEISEGDPKASCMSLVQLHSPVVTRWDGLPGGNKLPYAGPGLFDKHEDGAGLRSC